MVPISKHEHVKIGKSAIVHADCFDWLSADFFRTFLRTIRRVNISRGTHGLNLVFGDRLSAWFKPG